jgi:heme/copper-type cytochrome/quinol oxidase subunit 4
MSPSRWTLVALLVASTALFAVGVIAERSDADAHSEVTGAEVGEHQEGAAEPEGAHQEESEGTAAEAHETGGGNGAGDSHSDEDESLLGVDLEVTPLVALAVIVGLGLAALAATRYGQLPGFLGLVAAIALIWAALDVREFLHLLDESRSGIAVVAITVAALHLAAAAVSGRLAVAGRHIGGSSPDRPGTMPA